MATVSNIFWTSSSPIFSQTLYTGPSTTDNPNYQFQARAGLNGALRQPPDSSAWELSLTVPTLAGGAPFTGRLTWDALHGVPGARPFHSIFQVRFVMSQARVLASAGTTPYLEAGQQEYVSIDRIRLAAAVLNAGPAPVAHREVCWESAEIVFQYDADVRTNESREFYYLTALPRAASPQRLKLGTQANLQQADHFEQYLELTVPPPPTTSTAKKIVGFELVGLVSFRANDPAFVQMALGADDLQLKVAVWTLP